MDNRTFTANFVLLAGTQPGTYEQRTVLDTTYQRASGVVTYLNKDGGTTGLRVGLRTDTAVHVSPTNVAYLGAGADCPKRERLTPVNIPCDGQNLTVQFVLTNSLATDLNIDVVFQLERNAR